MKKIQFKWFNGLHLFIAAVLGVGILAGSNKGNNTFSYKINAEMSDGYEQTLVPSSIPIEHNNGLALKERIEMMLLAADDDR